MSDPDTEAPALQPPSTSSPTGQLKRARKHRLSATHVAQNFCYPIKEASKALGISVTRLKPLCRKYGIIRWPYRTLRALAKTTPTEDLQQDLAKGVHTLPLASELELMLQAGKSDVTEEFLRQLQPWLLIRIQDDTGEAPLPYRPTVDEPGTVNSQDKSFVNLPVRQQDVLSYEAPQNAYSFVYPGTAPSFPRTGSMQSVLSSASSVPMRNSFPSLLPRTPQYLTASSTDYTTTSRSMSFSGLSSVAHTSTSSQPQMYYGPLPPLIPQPRVLDARDAILTPSMQDAVNWNFVPYRDTARRPQFLFPLERAGSLLSEEELRLLKRRFTEFGSTLR